MWIMTTGGFVSAVQHFENTSLLMVRGRDRKSLENMLESIRAGVASTEGEAEYEVPEIQSQGPGEHWDYPHRVVVSKFHFQHFLIEEVTSWLTYSNFKSQATRDRGETYHKALMNVWTDMRALTEPQYRPAAKGTVGKYGSTYSGYDAWKNYGSKGSEDAKVDKTIGPADTTDVDDILDSFNQDYEDRDKPREFVYDGTTYTWDDDGNITGAQPRYRSIHDMPYDPMVDVDDIIDVDEEGAPILGRAAGMWGDAEDELMDADAVPLSGFHVDEDLDPEADRLNDSLDDSIYSVNNLTADDEARIDKEADERFNAWLARRERDDAMIAAAAIHAIDGMEAREAEAQAQA